MSLLDSLPTVSVLLPLLEDSLFIFFVALLLVLSMHTRDTILPFVLGVSGTALKTCSLFPSVCCGLGSLFVPAPSGPAASAAVLLSLAMGSGCMACPADKLSKALDSSRDGSSASSVASTPMGWPSSPRGLPAGSPGHRANGVLMAQWQILPHESGACRRASKFHHPRHAA